MRALLLLALLTTGCATQSRLDTPLARYESEGYAWHVERDAKGRLMIHKGGGMPQYATQIVHHPEQRVVIVWASNNLEKRWRQDLNQGLAELLVDAD